MIAYGDDDDSENLVGGEHPADLLEIFYMPIRALDGSVIAVGEFYHNLEVNNRSIMTTIHGSWLIQLVFVVLAF